MAEEAARRESIYLPVVVIEFNAAESAQYFMPMFLAKSEIKMMEGAKLSLERHEKPLAETCQSLRPIRGGCAAG